MSTTPKITIDDLTAGMPPAMRALYERDRDRVLAAVQAQVDRFAADILGPDAGTRHNYAATGTYTSAHRPPVGTLAWVKKHAGEGAQVHEDAALASFTITLPHGSPLERVAVLHRVLTEEGPMCYRFAIDIAAPPAPTCCPHTRGPWWHDNDCPIAIEQLRADRERMRRQREAPLVALVNAVPEGLDANGWRAAVLAITDALVVNGIDGSEIRWRASDEKPGMTGSVERQIRERSETMAFRAYTRALTPHKPPPRERLTMRNRGPVLACDAYEE